MTGATWNYSNVGQPAAFFYGFFGGSHDDFAGVVAEQAHPQAFRHVHGV
jgi:hypothetical protein